MNESGWLFDLRNGMRKNGLFCFCLAFLVLLIVLDVWTVGSFLHSFFGGEIENDMISTLVPQDWVILFANILLIALYLVILVVMSFRLLRASLRDDFLPEAFLLLMHASVGLFCAVAELGHCFLWKSFFVSASDGLRSVAMIPVLLCFVLWLQRFRWLLIPVAAEGALASVTLILRALKVGGEAVAVLKTADDILFLSCALLCLVLAIVDRRKEEMPFGRLPFIMAVLFAVFALLMGLFLVFCRSLEDAFGLLVTTGETVLHSVRMNIVNVYLLLTVLLLLIHHFLHDYFTRLIEENAMATKLAANEEYAESLHRYEQSVRELKHDLSNHLRTAAMMCRDGKYEELGSYLDSLTEQADATKRRAFCANTLANYLLQMFDSRFEEKGISFECEAVLPRELDIPDRDLAAILNNLLQNALEAAENAPEGNRWVNFRASFEENGVIRIRCRNSYGNEPLREKDGRIRTRKADRASHGLGLGIIRKTAEKYGGASSETYGNGIFEAKVALPVTNGQSFCTKSI